jgi:hypothetical protein
MNEINSQTPYCKAATFTCTCCGYATTIYSDTEYVLINEEMFCDSSKGDFEENCISGIIYRDDIDLNDPLHPQCTYIPLSKYNCTSWDEPGLQIHWTDQPIHCHSCNLESMVFAEYTDGANMLKFYEKCVDALKSERKILDWYNDDVRRHLKIIG